MILPEITRTIPKGHPDEDLDFQEDEDDDSS